VERTGGKAIRNIQKESPVVFLGVGQNLKEGPPAECTPRKRNPSGGPNDIFEYSVEKKRKDNRTPPPLCGLDLFLGGNISLGGKRGTGGKRPPARKKKARNGGDFPVRGKGPKNFFRSGNTTKVPLPGKGEHFPPKGVGQPKPTFARPGKKIIPNKGRVFPQLKGERARG